MKKFLLGTVALIAFAAPAAAADLAARSYTKAPAYVPPAPIYNWTGFYIGGHVGGAFVADDSIASGTSSTNSRFLGGLQGGYDWQFAPNWVLGVEAQYSWLTGGNDTANFNYNSINYNYTAKQRGIGSVTGRLGYTWGPALVYAKGGYAFADYDEALYDSNGVAAAFSKSSQSGYTVGGGLEYLFTQNWSGKLEYQYFDFGNTTFFGESVKNDQHTVKAGLNYRFNWGGPVVAKY